MRPMPRPVVLGVIPARWGSTRFPGKPLAPLAGRPLIEHVWRRARAALCLGDLVVATDDARICAAVEAFGGTAVLTSPHHPSGTDRVAEVTRHRRADLVVNIQGDEPLLDPAHVEAAVRPLLEDPGLEAVTLAAPLEEEADWQSPHAVKVVTDLTGDALYFSRAPIPARRSDAGPAAATPLRHIGLYVWRRDLLLAIAALPPTPLEQSEQLEQLRLLEHGMRLRVVRVGGAAPGVDTPDDLERLARHPEFRA